ncbi:MAG: DUF2135 domain-containing protein, partial [Verrucomicrobiota bacterium]
ADVGLKGIAMDSGPPRVAAIDGHPVAASACSCTSGGDEHTLVRAQLPGAVAVGCRITQDMTTGYGPEEYLVRKALPGRYSIRVKHNGAAENRKASPTTVYLEVTKNFGRHNAKTKRTWRRVSPDDDLVEVATLVHRVVAGDSPD